MAREGQGYPCYQRDMMMMMTYIHIYIERERGERGMVIRKLWAIIIISLKIILTRYQKITLRTSKINFEQVI